MLYCSTDNKTMAVIKCHRVKRDRAALNLKKKKKDRKHVSSFSKCTTVYTFVHFVRLANEKLSDGRFQV